MSDYIKREDAVSVCRILADKMDDVGFTAVSQCIGAIKDIYAADVVKVVRCRDCIYAHETIRGWCCSHGICVDCIVREDFYCADGTRGGGDT